MAAGQGDLQGAPRLELAAHLRQVRGGRAGDHRATVTGNSLRGGDWVGDRHPWHRDERSTRPPSAHGDRRLRQGGRADDLDAVHESGLVDRRDGHDDPADPLPCDRGDHRQDARDRADLSAQPELPDQGDGRTVRADLLRAEEDAHRHREVQGRPGLAQLRRREIDRDAAGRKDEPGVADRAADPFAGLLDRRVGEPDDREARQPRGHIHLDPDEPAVEAMERGGRNDSQHGATLPAPAHPALIDRSPAALP